MTRPRTLDGVFLFKGDINLTGTISGPGRARDRRASVEAGATSDVTLSGEQTINGVLTSASRIGVVGQSAPAENGIYVTDAGAWTRATDADEDSEVTNGLNFLVSGAGSTKVEFRYVLTTADPITIGVTGLAFAEHQPGILDLFGDLTPQLAGPLDTFGQQVRWSKGADVASASALAVLADGNSFDVPGTDDIDTIDALGVGTIIILHFDGILTINHDAADLVLPADANIITQAGDHAIFHEYAAGDWRLVGYLRADGTALISVATWVALTDTAGDITSSDESVADEASIVTDIPGGNGGGGMVRAGDSLATTKFTFKSNGNVELETVTGDVVSTDTDGNLCLFANGAKDGVVVKNRLGAAHNIHIAVWRT